MADQKSTPTKNPSSGEGSVKDTIESILVAFILAFIFRAFVVEAFVIPTGSMGPTLMGAHMRFTCPECGYPFAVNFSTANDNNDIPAYGLRRADFHCPNCGYPVPRSRSSDDVSPVYFGDRILVLKYDYLFHQPDRWDVVVFKSPFEKTRDPTDPKYADNYIKRLVAEPLEAAMILDGDVYTAARDEQDLTRFQIRRKPRHVQDALWRIVNDNDYLPQLRNREWEWKQPWVVVNGGGWKGPRTATDPGHERVFQFNSSGDGTIAFDPEANPDTHALTDWLAYDDDPRFNSERLPVADLRLHCVYRRTGGDGPLRLSLTKRDDCFTAEFTHGHVALVRSKLSDASHFSSTGPTVWRLDQAAPGLNGTGPVTVELVNVDYRVSVLVNGREVIATDDNQYYPDVPKLLAEYRGRRQSDAKPFVRIDAAAQSCAIEHLSLWRDVYYLNSGYRLQPSGQMTGDPFWGSPDNVARLGPDEYFVLGDNSQVSLDARYWGAPVDLPAEGDYHVAPGRVPGRFMLGKAFFVYWPAGYRPGSLPYGIEPDFGDMRFIH